MTEVTADTNVYISALHFGGRPLDFLNAARAGAFRLAASPALISEIRRVLANKFQWAEPEIDAALAELAAYTTRVQPTQSLRVVQDDPDDDRILECAVAAGSRFIVTGDRHLLRLGVFGRIRIIPVALFLDILADGS